MEKTKAPKVTPSPQNTKSKEVGKAVNPTSQFVSMALDMTWKLAIVVLLPILAGHVLADRYSNNYYLLAGILVALMMAITVIYQSYMAANSINGGKGSK